MLAVAFMAAPAIETSRGQGQEKQDQGTRRSFMLSTAGRRGRPRQHNGGAHRWLRPAGWARLRGALRRAGSVRPCVGAAVLIPLLELSGEEEEDPAWGVLL